jgi:hypothetical protein
MNRQKGVASAAGVPGDLAQQTAGTARTRAETGEMGAKTGLLGAQTQEAQQNADQHMYMHHLGQALLHMPDGPERNQTMQTYAMLSGIKPEMMVLHGGQRVEPASPMGIATDPDTLGYVPYPGAPPQLLATKGQPAPGAVNPNHLAALKAGQVTEANFDAKYGAGAAKKAIGQ